jgi:hypothetical protein
MKYIAVSVFFFAFLFLSACQKDQYMELSLTFDEQAETSQLDSLKQALIRQNGILNVAIKPNRKGLIVCYDRFQTADRRILEIIHLVGLKEDTLVKKPWRQNE